jgi:hypothetical protein
MLQHGAWPPLDPRNWKILVKKLWKAALQDPSVADLEAPPPAPSNVSMMVVGVHPTFRIALTIWGR